MSKKEISVTAAFDDKCWQACMSSATRKDE